MKFIHAFTPGRLKLALIVLPFVAAAGYLGLFAADRYVSETIVAVRQANQDQGSLPGIALLLGGSGGTSRDDTQYLRQYIQSLDLMRRLDERLKLREHYRAPTKDWLFRLAPDADQETFLTYMRSRLELSYDDASGLLTMRVQGFDAAFSQQLAQAILEECERFVNEFSQRMARQQMAFGESELARSTERLQEARNKVLAFQSTNKLVDPSAQLQANSALTAELQASLARQELELRSATAYLNDESFQVKTLRSQIAATRAQLEAEKLRATSAAAGNERLNAIAVQYQELLAMAAFAQDTYRIALTSVENSRIEALRKIKSLVVIEPPSRPETAEYPRRVYNLVTLFVLSWLLYGIARLVIATIRDHIE